MVDLIVFGSLLLLAVFCVAWWARPDLRAWIERPKNRFQANVQSYDQVQKAAARSGIPSGSKAGRKPPVEKGA